MRRTAVLVTSILLALSSSAVGDVRSDMLKAINERLLVESARNQCAFKENSDVLEPDCKAKLDRLASELSLQKKKVAASRVGISFEVAAYTETSGDPVAQQRLSTKRAQVIARELTARGAAPAYAVGYGPAEPLVKPDDTPAKKAKNRRYVVRGK